SARFGARFGCAPLASSHASCNHMIKFRSASRLGKSRRGFGATSNGRHVLDRLPEGRRRPLIYLPPCWQSFKTVSHAFCCAVSRSASEAGSSRLSRVARFLNNSRTFGESFSSREATCPHRLRSAAR